MLRSRWREASVARRVVAAVLALILLSVLAYLVWFGIYVATRRPSPN